MSDRELFFSFFFFFLFFFFFPRHDALRESLSRLTGNEVRVFVKDNEDLRREKYAAQQAAKAAAAPAKKEEGAKTASASAPNKEKGGKEKSNSNAADKKKGGDDKKKGEEKASIGHLDIRVGTVLAASAHPDAETLYVEQIDVGEKEPRTIVSGIREHVKLEEFVGARVLVMCNLAAKPLRGVNSNGMIVCASKPNEADPAKKTVHLLEIDAGAKPGTRVVWEGLEGDVQPDPAPVSGSKLGKLLKELRTDETGTVVFGAGANAVRASAAGKPIACKKLPNGTVG